jgi:hypothetical protein
MRARAITAAGVLATVIAGCGSSPHHHRRPAPPQPQSAQFLPATVDTLARGTFPGGERFSIRSENYRLSGRTYLQLSVATARGGGSGTTPAQAKGPLAMADFGECSHPKVMIVYGLLRASADTVTVTAHGTHRRLRPVPIPAGVGAGGVLVYGLVDTPARIVVGPPSGPPAVTATVTGGSRQVCPTKKSTFSTLALLHP